MPEPELCAVVGTAPAAAMFLSVLDELGVSHRRFDELGEVTLADCGSVLVLADRYPEVSELDDAAAAGLAAYVRAGGRAYVEYATDRTGFLPTPDGPARVANFERIYVAEGNQTVVGFEPLTIFDEHSSLMLPVTVPRGASEVLTYGTVAGFYTALFGPAEESWPALYVQPSGDGRLFYASTALSNAERGRYRPAARWRTLIRHLIAALQPGPVDLAQVRLETRPRVWAATGDPVVLRVIAPGRDAIKAQDARLAEVPLTEVEPGVFESAPLELSDGEHVFTADGATVAVKVGPRDQRYREMVDRGISWFHNAGMFFDAPDGSAGVAEGFSSELGLDGTPPFRGVHRGDGYVQVAHAFRMYSELTGEAEHATVAGNLMRLVLERMQITDRNALYGSWEPRGPRTHLSATNNLFADDGGWITLFALASGALAQGLRGAEAMIRTANAELGLQVDPWRTPSTLLVRGWEETARTPLTEGLDLSSHWQSSALSAYLYAYGVTGEQRYLDIATRGLDHMATAFPRTRLETSRTCEAVRFLLPLVGGCLYTRKPLYLDTLRAIGEFLRQRQDPSGALAEWDGKNPTRNLGYGVDEASIFQANGDPVTDQLYGTGFAAMSLPLAYQVTGDPLFAELSTGMLDFLSRIQIDEGDPLLDGTWMRAFDFEEWEYFGSNADIGWGPYCVETGWSHAPTLIGALLHLTGSGLFPEPGADRTDLAAQIRAEFDSVAAAEPVPLTFTVDVDGRVVRDQGGVTEVLGDLVAAGRPVWVENPLASAVEIYVRGADGRLHHTYLDDRIGQGIWRPVGDLQIAGDPAVAFNAGTNAVEVYARGVDGRVHHATLLDVRAGHATWFPLGDLQVESDPVVAYDPEVRSVRVSARDKAGVTWHTVKENRWHPPWLEIVATRSRWETA